jgi:ABC-type hemin transport system ATPase subunit
MADQIVLLREGTVAFSGSPTDLLKAQRQAQAAAMTGSA